MKKFLGILMAVVMVLTISSFSMITFATQGEELIENGNFSSYNPTTYWKSQTNATFSRTTVDGNYVLKVTNRSYGWSSPYQDIKSDITKCGWGDYDISYRVKLLDTSIAEEKFVCVIKLMFSDNEAEAVYYENSVMASGTEFKGYSATINIQNDKNPSDLKYALIYFQMKEQIDYYIDDVSMRKTDKSTYAPVNNGPITNRPTETSVGVIRWDAWVNPSEEWHSGNADTRTIGQQMVDSLSPREYHYRVPFFANILGSNSITFPDYTQEIFDQEMRYAKEAGIDYFMYCWYGDYDVMSTARKLHATSKYRNDVKMSAMWTLHDIDGYGVLEYRIENLKQDYWFRVDGRPLIYITAGQYASIQQINRFRQACINAGVGNPYLIGLYADSTNPSDDFTTDHVKTLGYDAISTYATYQGKASDYSKLVETTEKLWTNWQNAGVEVVPLVSTGWNRNPRVTKPTSWEWANNGTNQDYTKDGTPAEIAKHLQDAINFNNNYKTQTSANTVLMYAWNEHDEGGWICPTISVDSNGMPLKNADGSYKRDVSRLQAIQKVLKGSDAVWSLTDENVTYGFQGANLNLGSTLTINYYAVAKDGFKVQFTMNGKTREVDGVLDSNLDMYRYAFDGINPQCMNDIIDAVLLDANGNVVDEKLGYSVRTYCNNKANSSMADNNFTTMIKQEALIKLLADTLNYGAEAQKYRDYKTDTLANSELWVIQNQSSFKKPQGVANLKGNQNTEGQIKSAGLSISNVNKLYFRLILNNPDVVVNLNGNVIDRQSLEYNNANGTYVLYTQDLTATEFDKVFTLTLSLNGQTISSLKYNVKAYVEAKCESATVGGIVKALNNYGDSATYYTKAINENLDLDFDLGFGENFTDNVVPYNSSNFDYVVTPYDTDWYVPSDWYTDMYFIGDDHGGQALAFVVDRNAIGSESWESVALNIRPYVKAGTYNISFRYKTVGLEGNISVAIRQNVGTVYTYNGGFNVSDPNGWVEVNLTVTITEHDLAQTALNFCFHTMTLHKGVYDANGVLKLKAVDEGYVAIDDFQIIPN